MQTVSFDTHRATHTEYVVGRGALSAESMRAALERAPVAIIVDRKVQEHHQTLLRQFTANLECVGVMPVTGGEGIKAFEHLQAVTEFLVDRGLPKHGCVIAIGGGTVCDIAAMAAMLVRRGVALALVPTTLLAQIDAAIGGKNGINLDTAKNVVGHFYHPHTVVCDPAFLVSLGRRELVCGIAEGIKLFAVADGAYFETRHEAWAEAIETSGGLDWAELVENAVRGKLRLLADDPFELSSRRLLNYGHAFAHLFEERSKYALWHGEAVLLGMLIENEVSRSLGIARRIDALQNLICRLLTRDIARYWQRFSAVGGELATLKYARRGKMNLVCIAEPGDARIIDDVSDAVLRDAWLRAGEIVARTTESTRECTRAAR
jgi:3-dehydroquinate synthase